MAKVKRQIEYRYYEMPSGHYVIALLGEGWVQNYKPEIEGLLHFHNYFEIGYCYWGDGRMVVDEGEYDYRGNMVTFIPKNIPHVTVSNEGSLCKWEYLFIDIETFIRNEITFKRMLPEEVIKRINKKGYILQCSQNKQLASLVRNIIKEYAEKKPHYKDCVIGYLRALVIELVRLDEAESDNTNLEVKKHNNYIEKSVQYIAERYVEDIKMEDIAKICGLSESHFRRIFEESMGMKPLDYVNMVRIDKACELIAEQDLAMEEVGFRVGYQTPSTFNRNFKKLTGKTPYQWKKEESHMDGATANYKVSAKKGWQV